MREITEVHECVGRQARNGQGGDGSRWSRNRYHVPAGSESCFHQLIARIIDGRRSCIRDEGYISTGELFENEIQFVEFVVLEVAGKRRFDLEMLEQLAGMTRV